jgi:hypothetical protein
MNGLGERPADPTASATRRWTRPTRRTGPARSRCSPPSPTPSSCHGISKCRAFRAGPRDDRRTSSTHERRAVAGSVDRSLRAHASAKTPPGPIPRRHRQAPRASSSMAGGRADRRGAGGRASHATCAPAQAIDPKVVVELALKADAEANVDFRRRFWEFPGEQAQLTPTLLVYADLLVIGDARCLETAQLLRGPLLVPRAWAGIPWPFLSCRTGVERARNDSVWRVYAPPGGPSRRGGLFEDQGDEAGEL